MELAQIEDAMDSQKLTNVAIAQPPTLPYTPVRPRPFLDAPSFTANKPVFALSIALKPAKFIATSRTGCRSRYPLLATVWRDYLSSLSG
jgi:hypothetical protein